MDEDYVNEELSIMYEKAERIRVLDSESFRLPVKSLRVRKPVAVSEKDKLGKALDIMRSKHIGCLLVTGAGGRLAGILTERDVIRRALTEGTDPGSLAVRDIMTPDPESVEPDDTIAAVMNAMHVGGYRHVPVVDGNNVPLAVVSVKDVVAFIVENFSEDILNLPPRSRGKAPTEDGG